MSFAADFNTSITAWTLKQVDTHARRRLAGARTATGRLPSRPEIQELPRRTGMPPNMAAPYGGRTGKSTMQTLLAAYDYPEIFSLGACSLEFQHGQYRAFRRADGDLLHSHFCKAEVIRRTERDGYHFTLGE